jgi:hypothetical protein
MHRYEYHGASRGASVWISTRCQEFTTPIAVREHYEIRRGLRYLSCVVVVARVGRLACLLAVVAACGSKAVPAGPSAANGPVKFPAGPPILTPHESMSYRLALGGMDLATYDLAAGDITDLDGHKVIVVQSHAKTRGLAARLTNVDDVFTSWIDIETGRPRRWSVEESTADGKVRERTDARLDQRAEDVVPVQVWLDEKPGAMEPQKVSMEDVWDYNAYLIALRAWEGQPGSTITSEVFRSRYLWHVTMTIGGEEQLVTDLGEFPTLRFDGRAYRLTRDGKRSTDADERAFSIWITNDSGRVPVLTKARTDYGDIELAIVNYEPGTGERLRP